MELLPSRAYKTSWNLQSRYVTHYNSFTTDQKRLVRDVFIERVGDGFRAKSVETIRREMQQEAGSTAHVNALLLEDDIVKEHKTDWATDYFRKDSIRVRRKLLWEYPNTFEDRYWPKIVRDPAETTFGWRHVDADISLTSLAGSSDFINGGDVVMRITLFLRPLRKPRRVLVA